MMNQGDQMLLENFRLDLADHVLKLLGVNAVGTVKP